MRYVTLLWSAPSVSRAGEIGFRQPCCCGWLSRLARRRNCFFFINNPLIDNNANTLLVGLLNNDARREMARRDVRNKLRSMHVEGYALPFKN